MRNLTLQLWEIYKTNITENNKSFHKRVMKH